MDGGYFPAVQLCYIAQMLHRREVALCDGNSVRHDLTRPDRRDAVSACRQREHADPIKQAPQPDLVHISGGPDALRSGCRPAWLP